MIVNKDDTLDEVFTKIRDAGDAVGVSVFVTGSLTNTGTDKDLAGYSSTTWANDTRFILL